MKTIALIGAPTDVGASVRGAGMGPDALRVAGLVEALEARKLAVIDRGNLHGPANPWLEPVNGLRHLKEAIDWNQAVYDAVEAALAAGHMPMMLGGDHCLAIGSISAIASHCRKTGKKLRVLWFDAHADSNLSTISPTGNIHGMPVACLMGHGPKELINYGGHSPAMQPGDIRLIGIRSVDEGERRFIHEMGMQVFDMRYIDEHGMRAVMTSALEGLDADTHLHVSFDLDCLDPAIAPGVGTAVLGGPTYREAQLCMEMIADTGMLASLDVVELNPALDLRNQTAELAVDLIESLFGKSTLVRLKDAQA
ncbi:MAG: arginase [Undibacterium sp.]|uniref:arginase n=1 Tax=Undibacterium sp. TaxID=1914977 RepID=UPI00271E67E1|nr:arginase [Undibacterium sp.]MDO8654234.1 arginase [Undibacterium sp.]